MGLRQSTFVAIFMTFLTQCVDYSKIPDSKVLGDITIPQCTRKMSVLWNFGLWLYTFYLIWKVVQFLVDLRRLSYIRNFYTHLLNIPEQDMQTVSWQDIVVRIMALRDANPKTAPMTPFHRRWIGSQSKERLDAHDIANRLMRRDNYLIAMINKDILNLTLPLPLIRGRQLYSRTLEWYLQFSILDLIFDEVGQVNQEFLKANRRGRLSQKIRQRFIFSGCITLISMPFFLSYMVVVYFFTYYNVSSHTTPCYVVFSLLLGAGISERPVGLDDEAIYTTGGMEIQGIQ
jgi:autophagy-related protein 9